jgi:ubiquinone/menaquinone biosynthesis C-methylase UbiE
MKSNPSFKMQMSKGYDRIALEYDARLADYSARFCSDMIDLMYPQAGEYALDLAGGTGAAAIKMAERIGSSGTVTIVDLSPAMLEVAKQKAAARNLSNVSTRVMDAEELEYPDRSFDLITCAQAAMAFPNIKKALSEAMRVLKPGGRIGFTAWSLPARIPFLTFPSQAMIRQMAPQPVKALLHLPVLGEWLLHRIMAMRGPQGYSPVRFGRPGTLERYLTAAGFQSVRRDLRAYPIEFETFEAYWETLTQGTTMRSMSVPADVLEAVRTEIRPLMANPANGKVLLINEVALILARKPA